ncbi:hypothetical protein JX265_007264 [Neoarthrinium moseri]|uniref:Uncharacterized protein n=1 Tax=Neoarthrinium moseri TaxID=1658444 RepID=A0A9P9WJZ9_9PEZI|nr:uncharacterized protein JN550_012105 [Neoarthrinium moseri]KAI1850939.1 hypothetical protein JX266_003604 [Neoarthrinium moseri]KAI1859296.1 hypothetical protein JN550_012105 [Neoarthrinium moseri]KAI1867462.1 hypothetical protein JX265_007264 [Neoarthrinium moseri]
MSTSSSDFQKGYNDTQNTVKAVSTGIIVAIVLTIVGTIGFTIALVVLLRRQKKRRDARNAAFEPIAYNSNTQNAPRGYPSPQPPFQAPSPAHSYQPGPYGNNVSPRYEAPNTPAPYPEAPNNEVEPKKPYDNAAAELGGSDVKYEPTRNELPA